MSIKYSFIFCVLVALLAFQSANGQSEVTDKTTQDISVQQADLRIENLMKQARELFEAYDKADFDKFAAFYHPKAYEKGGLKELFEEFNYANSDRLETSELLPSSVETPKELIEFDKQLFGVVPYKLNGISRIKKDKEVFLGSMVGISEDEGKSWKFIKGVAFNEAFPNVAGMIPIPNPVEKRLENDIEQ